MRRMKRKSSLRARYYTPLLSLPTPLPPPRRPRLLPTCPSDTPRSTA